MAGSWWDRNWFWSIPCSCCFGCLTFPTLIGLLVAGGSWYQISGSSGVYEQTLERARMNTELQEALGTPIRAKWKGDPDLESSVNISLSPNSAELQLPLDGPNGSAVIFAEAEKEAGEWVFQRLEAEVAGRSGIIDLLAVEALPHPQTGSALESEGESEVNVEQPPQPVPVER